MIVTFALQAPVRWSAARLHGAPRLLLADVYHFVSFLATVNVWRGVWGLLDIYFFPGEFAQTRTDVYLVGVMEIPLY